MISEIARHTVGADVLRVAPTTPTGSSVAASPPFWKAAPLAVASVGVVVVPSRALALAVTAGVTTDLAGNHFDVEHADGSRTVSLSSYSVRPWLAIGSSIPLPP